MFSKILLTAFFIVALGAVGYPLRAQADQPVITAANAAKVKTVGRLGYGIPNSHAISPDGTHIALGTQFGLLVLDTSNLHAKPVFVDIPLGVDQVEYSPNGDYIGCGGAQGSVALVDTKTFQVAKTFKGEAYKIDRMAFHPTDPVIAAGISYVGKIHAWNYETGQEVANLLIKDQVGISGVAFSPDGKQLKAFGGLVRVVWENYVETERVTYNSNQAIQDAAFNPTNPAQFGFALQDNTEMLEVKGSTQNKLEFQDKAQPYTVAFSPDGKLFAAGWANGMVYIQDTTNGDMVTKFKVHQTNQPLASAARRVQFSPDGTRLWISTFDGEIESVDPKTGKELLAETVLPGVIRSLASTADGMLIAGSGENDGRVHLWNLAKREEVAQLDDQRYNIAIAFSLDGKMLATGGVDFGTDDQQSIHIWDISDLAAPKLVQILKFHTAAVNAVAFSPDGKRLASASSDKRVRVWDTKTGGEVYTISGFSDRVNSLMFSGEGGTLLTGTADGYLSLYNAPDGKFSDKTQGDRVKNIKSLTVNNNSTKIIIADEDNAQTFSLNLKTPIDPIPGYSSLSGRLSVISPDNNLLVADINSKDQLWMVDLNSKSSIVAKVDYGSNITNGIIFSPDGALILSAGRNGYIELFGVK